MILWCACVAAEGLALALSWRLARRAPHGPVVSLCAFAVVADLWIQLAHVLVLADAPRPFAGGARALYHVETALVLGWPALLAATCWRAFGRTVPVLSSRLRDGRRGATDYIAGAWLGLVVGLAVVYPIGRARTQLVLHVAELAAVAVATLAVVAGWRRPWGRVHVALILLVAVETTVALVGPFMRDVFVDWRLAQVSYLIGFTALSLLSWGWLRRPTAPR